MRISKATVAIGLFIIVSASFMRQLMELFKAHFGERSLVISLGLILIIAGLAFLIFILRNYPGPMKASAIMILLVIGIALAWQLEIPQERVHIFEYGLLGWFASRDLMAKKRRIRGIVLAWMLTIMVGVLDEAFQAILPYRVWDVRDVLFNSLGGIWGIVLYLLS